MSRDALYFIAPKRAGGWRVVKTLEHGPHHSPESRPKSWRGPYASDLDARHAIFDLLNAPSPELAEALADVEAARPASTTPVRLVRLTFYVACEPNADESAEGLEAIGDGIVEHLRGHRTLQALTVASDVDEVTVPLNVNLEEAGDELIDALTAQWPELTTEERTMLDEAIDSHIYWQLSDQHYRNDGYVKEPGSDDDENADAIETFHALAAKLTAPRQANEG